MQYRRRTQGFTLIEIMIVVVVLSVLASIAVPSYREHVMKVRRGDAQGALMGAANALEKFYVDERDFTQLARLGDIYATTAPVGGSEVFYQLEFTPDSTRDFTLRAIPKNAQSGDKCGTLTLTRSGRRGVTGTLPVDRCWRS